MDVFVSPMAAKRAAIGATTVEVPLGAVLPAKAAVTTLVVVVAKIAVELAEMIVYPSPKDGTTTVRATIRLKSLNTVAWAAATAE